MANINYDFVSIADISDNNCFRVSRQKPAESLIQSIRELGMLEVPLIVRDGSSFTAFTCHNRLSMLRQLGVSGVRCGILQEPDMELFVRNTALKVRRGEVGPAGKIKSLAAARDFFRYPDMNFFCKNVLNVSDELLKNDFVDRIMALPLSLRDYIDMKDIGFRVIRDIASLPAEMICEMDTWVSSMQVRAGVFRMIVEYLFDLAAMPHAVTLPGFTGEDRVDDKKLFDEIFRLRFPHYSKQKVQADRMVAGLVSPGLSVDFPEYFERDFLTLKIDIKRNEKAGAIAQRLQRIDTAAVEQLLAMLN